MTVIAFPAARTDARTDSTPFAAVALDTAESNVVDFTLYRWAALQGETLGPAGPARCARAAVGEAA
ncbi:MAG: hypothetical protein AAFR79_14830 [Pseudomonadota bacterium]